MVEVYRLSEVVAASIIRAIARTTIRMYRQILVKLLYIILHKNPFSVSAVVTCGETDERSW
jgi:hypothetical protein